MVLVQAMVHQSLHLMVRLQGHTCMHVVLHQKGAQVILRPLLLLRQDSCMQFFRHQLLLPTGGSCLPQLHLSLLHHTASVTVRPPHE